MTLLAKSGTSDCQGPRLRAEVVIRAGDAYFSADVETDGPIPGPYSMLSFALAFAGSFDGKRFSRPNNYDDGFYAQLAPISDDFEVEALAVNGLDRDALIKSGTDPAKAMADARRWIEARSAHANPVLVAYPLSFDWSWLYWYFVRFTGSSPFKHSRCFDIKTAAAVKLGLPISDAGRKRLPAKLQPRQRHTHHAVDDAIAQAEIFANLFELEGVAPREY
ncbi:MAG TPA: exonuclease [Nannocystis exedens]|nr:exonuclease [Nannocystis exedens]